MGTVVEDRAPNPMFSLLSWGPNGSVDTMAFHEPKVLAPKSLSPVRSVQPALPIKRKLEREGDARHLQTPVVCSNAFVHSASQPLVTLPNTPTLSGAIKWQPPQPLVSDIPTNSAPRMASETRTSTAGMQAKTAPEMSTADRKQKLRIVTTKEIGLEILLKHNELRLIDQELAKCQIALEQLRRCSEIPYPGTQLSENVSHGVGPALRQHNNTIPAPSPAPWGVTDGPYTRHYARWLLPDPQFDGGQSVLTARTPAGKTTSKGRSTRGNVTESPVSAGKSRSRNNPLQTTPGGEPFRKEKAGPMILKRKSDGKMVKLVCLDCAKNDFGSAQGFINHCRIQHRRHFTSHDQAAEESGEVVEVDESGAIIGAETLSATTSSIHPLIRSAHLLKKDRTSVGSSSTVGIQDEVPSTRDPRSTLPRDETASPNFQASLQTPNLSALVAKRGFGLNLQDLVTDAQTKVETSDSDVEADDMEVDIPPEQPFHGRHPQIVGSKQPVRSHKAVTAPPPPIGSCTVPVQPPVERAVSSVRDFSTNPVAYRGHAQQINSTTGTPENDTAGLEPSPTMDSNQAPSLVDDDEEYEAHSPTSSSVSGEHDSGEIDFEVEGDEMRSFSALPSPASTTMCSNASTPARHQPTQPSRPSALRSRISSREEKHVSFVSPSPSRSLNQEAEGSDRKRRRQT